MGGATLVRGIGLGGATGVRTVELSTDGRTSWPPTTLGRDEGKYSFRQWQAEVTLPAGAAVLMVRCTQQRRIGPAVGPELEPERLYAQCNRVHARDGGGMNVSFSSVAFGRAIVAGLVLAIVGHPSRGGLPVSVAPVVATNAPKSFALKSVTVDLPLSDAAFPGPANSDAIAVNCLSCHSAGMVVNQPALSKAAWARIVGKLIHTYQAPVAGGDIPAIVDHLLSTKGAAVP